MIFVKVAVHCRHSFFKHKNITQPTVMPANLLVKAYQDLAQAIQGIPNAQGTAYMEALACVEKAIEPQTIHID